MSGTEGERESWAGSALSMEPNAWFYSTAPVSWPELNRLSHPGAQVAFHLMDFSGMLSIPFCFSVTRPSSDATFVRRVHLFTLISKFLLLGKFSFVQLILLWWAKSCDCTLSIQLENLLISDSDITNCFIWYMIALEILRCIYFKHLSTMSKTINNYKSRPAEWWVLPYMLISVFISFSFFILIPNYDSYFFRH